MVNSVVLLRPVRENPGRFFRAHARKNIVKAETIRYICVISPYWAVKGLINTQNEMKTKHLLLSFLAVAALVSACRKDKEPGEEGQDQVQAVTVTEFLAAPESDTQVYELVGTIEGNINTTYGFFDLKDETGSVYVYGLTATPLGYGTKNDHSYSSLGLNPGDRIRIRGYRGSYGDKIEMMYAWFVKKVSGDTPGGDTTTAGTVDNPYTVAQALDAVKGLTWTSNTDYESTDDVYMKGRISRIESKGTFTEGGTYGNASFYISDDGAEKNEFYCFRILYLGNTKFAEGQTDIRAGDDVVICGKLMNYKGNTPETVAGKAYLYSLKGGGGGGPSSGEKVSFATNSDAQTWSARTDGTYGAGFVMEREDLRKKVAKRMERPPYVIFQDVSIDQMATDYPITLEELKNIQGVGEGKVKQPYAKEFTDLIKKYCEENEIERQV